jgi:dienelactone hydrolase
MNESKPSIIQRFPMWLRRAGQAISPGRRAWTGAALGLLITALAFVIPANFATFGGTGALGLFLGFVGYVLIALAAAGAVWLLQRLLILPPGFFVAVAAGSLAAIYMTLFGLEFLGFNTQRFQVYVFVIACVLGAAVWVLVRGGWKQATLVRRVIIAAGLVAGLVGVVGGGYWFLRDGRPIEPPINAAAQAQDDITPLSLPDPSQPGEHKVQTLFYGGGNDLHRPEYGSEVDIVTQPVDGSLLVSGWSPLRRDYWGFGPEAMPLNGRVWYPDSAASGEAGGPFPLVLIVHGNHIAEDYSDPGYAYLGDLFASRGFIFVSVDENFLNISPSADLVTLWSLRGETDARGWLLLEHLRLWKSWNETTSNPFYQKVDTEHIALIGHSRGGEAAAVAAAFNNLPCYPDNAALAFDYHFGIRAVAAIAPVDGGYRPTGLPLPLEDLSYFVLHGAQDMQATSFQGRRMYERLRFTDDGFHFKSALYFYGANHGQFNSAWGRKDIDEPAMRLFNQRALMPEADQQQIAKVYLSAFVEAVLRDETGYLPLFRDSRYSSGWLPDTIYLTQYNDSATSLVSTFDGDIDLTTTELPDGSAHGDNLTTWREGLVPTKDFDDLHTRAVYLGWDSTAVTGPAAYTIQLPESGLTLNAERVLTFALADANEASPSSIDLTLELVDKGSNTARLPLSHYAFLQPRIESHIFKADWLSSQPSSEIVFQNFEFPLSDFVQANPAFDPGALAAVRLVFDRTPQGAVYLDDVGFR